MPDQERYDHTIAAIDGVLARGDHELMSADAMRWAPPETHPEPTKAHVHIEPRTQRLDHVTFTGPRSHNTGQQRVTEIIDRIMTTHYRNRNDALTDMLVNYLGADPEQVIPGSLVFTYEQHLYENNRVRVEWSLFTTTRNDDAFAHPTDRITVTPTSRRRLTRHPIDLVDLDSPITTIQVENGYRTTIVRTITDPTEIAHIADLANMVFRRYEPDRYGITVAGREPNYTERIAIYGRYGIPTTDPTRITDVNGS